MTKAHIDPLDDAAKRAVLQAVAELGQASGLEAAAKILVALADDSMRVVGTKAILEIAAGLRAKAASLRTNADGAIRALEATS